MAAAASGLLKRAHSKLPHAAIHATLERTPLLAELWYEIQAHEHLGLVLMHTAAICVIVIGGVVVLVIHLIREEP